MSQPESTPSQLSPEQEEEYWTRLAAMKTQFESFATSYIKTLDACVCHRCDGLLFAGRCDGLLFAGR